MSELLDFTTQDWTGVPYVIELRGGPACGKRFASRSLPPMWRVPEFTSPSALWTEPVEPVASFHTANYRPTGSVRDDGTHTYAFAGYG